MKNVRITVFLPRVYNRSWKSRTLAQCVQCWKGHSSLPHGRSGIVPWVFGESNPLSVSHSQKRLGQSPAAEVVPGR